MLKRNFTRLVLSCTVGLTMSSGVRAADLYWDLNGTAAGAGATPTGTWDTSLLNWNTLADGTGVPIAWTAGNVARFSAGTDAVNPFAITVTGTQSVGGIIVEEGTVSIASGVVALGGNTLRIDSGARFSIPLTSNLTASAGAIVSLQGGTFRSTSNSSGSTFLSSNATLQIGSAGGTVETANTGSNSAIYAGTITGAGNVLTKTGTGEFRYQGTGLPNTTFAKLVVNQGLYRLGSASGTADERGFGAVPVSPLADAITLDGGAIGTSFAVSLHTNRGITLAAGGGDIITSAATLTIPSVISGSGNLTHTSSGTAILSGNNTYIGATIITAGAFQLGHANALGTTAGNTQIASGAGVTVDNITSLTVNEPFQIAGSGVGGTAGAITVTNNASATFGGPITLSGDAALNVSGSSSVSFTNTISATNLNLTLSGGGLTTGNGGSVSGAISLGSGTLTKSGNGRWILSGPNSYGGATNITAGVLNIQSASALGTAAGGTTVSSGAALQTQGDLTIAEPLALSGLGASSGGALRHISGNVNLTGPITLGSATRINADAGNLTLSNSGPLAGSVFSLTVGGAGNITMDSAVVADSLTKDGTGTLTLKSSANALTNAMTVGSNGGKITIANGAVVTANSASVGSNSVLDHNGALTSTLGVAAGGTLQGTGTINGTTTIDGNLKPGNLTAGKLTINAPLFLQNAAVTTMEILNPGVAGVSYDTVAATSVSYEGQLNVDFSASGTFAAGDSFNLFDGTPFGGSDFNGITLSGQYTGVMSMLGGGNWSLDTSGLTFLFTGVNGVLSLSAQAVPEPLTAAGVLLLTTRLAGRRTRASL